MDRRALHRAGLPAILGVGAVLLLVATAVLGGVAPGASVAGVAAGQEGADCPTVTDGAVFVTDSGLYAVHDGASVGASPFVDETTLAFPNVTLRAAGNASVTVASATRDQVCVRAVEPTAADVVVSPAAGPTVTVSSPLERLSYGRVDYAATANGTDLAYESSATTALNLAVDEEYGGRTVEAVAVDSRDRLGSGTVDDAGTLSLELPAGAHQVNLRVGANESVDANASSGSADRATDGTETFDVEITATNAPVEAGESLAVTVTVTNTGERAATQTVTLTDASGRERDSVDVSLESGETNDSVALVWQTVDEDVGTDTVVVASETDSAATTATVGRASGPDWQGEMIDYHPSPQTQHVGGFLPLAAVLALGGLWVLVARDAGAATLLAAVLLVGSVRAASDLLQVLVDEVGGMAASIAAINLSLELGIAVLFVRFATVYAGEARLETRRAKGGLAVLAALGTVTALTNPAHGLVFTDVSVVSEPFTYVWTSVGPLGWLLFATNTGLLVAGGGLVLRTMLGLSLRRVWRPAAVVTTGLGLAVLVGVLSMLDRGPVAGYDYGGAGANYFILLTTVTVVGQGLQRLKTSGQESVIADIEDPVLILDDDWHVVECNDAAEELLPGIGVGRDLDSLLAAPVERPSADETTTTMEVRLPGDDRQPGADEKRRHFVVRASAVTTGRNDVIGYTVQFADVTELRRQIAGLEAKNDQLDRFAAAIAADLRTPLLDAADVTGQAIGLLEGASGPEETDQSRLRAHLSEIGDAFERMEAIIEDVLGLARGEPFEVDPRPVAFADLVEATWDGIDAPGARLHVEASGRLTADTHQLQRLLAQLLRRAVDHGSQDAPVRVGLDDEQFFVASGGGSDAETARTGPAERGTVTTDDGVRGDDPLTDDGSDVPLDVARQRADAHGWTLERVAADGELRFTVAGCDTDLDGNDDTGVSG